MVAVGAAVGGGDALNWPGRWRCLAGWYGDVGIWLPGVCLCGGWGECYSNPLVLRGGVARGRTVRRGSRVISTARVPPRSWREGMEWYGKDWVSSINSAISATVTVGFMTRVEHAARSWFPTAGAVHDTVAGSDVVSRLRMCPSLNP